jgi:outer membrane protein assembly factor BamB
VTRALGLLALAALAACGGAAGRPAAAGTDWRMFGYTPARPDSGPASTGITAANVKKLRRQRIHLDGTVDSSAIYLHDVRVGGKTHDTFFVTTTYGRTEAIDAATGRVLWRYTPPGFSSWVGSYRITTATPVADPGRAAIYASSPDGVIQKLRVSDGRALWRVPITRLPEREKITSSLNFAHGHVIATTGGYIGDAPPYQGHVAVVDPAGGKLLHVWNSLCSDQAGLIDPSSCPNSASAIWGRSGAVVEPGSGALLVATGNGHFDGKTYWGDSLLRLDGGATRLLGSWTPTNQAELDSADLDLGSTSPAYVGGGLAVQGGKDGRLRLVDVRRLSLGGLGGELQTVSTPGGDDLFTAPAVWRSRGITWIFVGDGAGLDAWKLASRRLVHAWSAASASTSPVVAGGLLYAFDPNGGLRVYAPRTGRLIVTLRAGTGHWSTPIVADGRIALPEGNANEHATSGVLDVYRR